MSRRTKALDIPQKEKQEIYERDKWCIFCGRQGMPNAHYISRAKGGLGIKENVVTLCIECHRRLDQSCERKSLLEKVKAHLDYHYPNFDDKDRVYKKW